MGASWYEKYLHATRQAVLAEDRVSDRASQRVEGPAAGDGQP